jgi:tetratricopeptide (TPR) repeat protein
MRLKFWIPVLLLPLVLLMVSGCAKRVGDESVNSEPAVASPQGHVREHEIISGESLSQIADNYYGDPDRAAAIARDNGITDADRIIPGSVLHLKFTDSEWAIAERRATALVAYNKGVDFFAQDRLAEAEKQFKLALKTAPDLSSARYNLALVHIKRGKSSMGLAILEDLTALRPKSTDYRFARGHALFQLGRFNDAADQFKILTEAHPGHKRGVFSLARSLQEAGDKAGARKTWQQYLELDDTSGWAKTARKNLKKLG